MESCMQLVLIVLMSMFGLGESFISNNITKVDLSWQNNLKLLEHMNKSVAFSLSDVLCEDFVIELSTSHQHTSESGVNPVSYPHQFTFPKNETSASLQLSAAVVGQIVIFLNSSSEDLSFADNSRLRVYVIRSYTIKVVNQVVGWIYFVAWSVSFYPQVILNFRRKSVVGLNFDFLAYNLTGFIAYCLYNIGLFWIPLVQQQYLEKYPDGVNPVQVNDVFFTIHAIALTTITIIQCFIYERGGQQVSRLASLILSLTWLAMFVLLFVAVAKKITWLDYLMIFSYVKLGVTLIKYIPQACMNYRRKSTIGWSIGNVLLDFTGGSLSILQMLLQAYNNDEWSLIIGDPTKFGLGLFSIFFDIIFMVQHYILYRHNKLPLESLLDQDSDDE